MKGLTGNSRGHLILELVLAMFIISVALVGILNGFHSMFHAQAVMNSNSRCLFLLEQKVAELESEGEFREGFTDGEFKGEQGFRWEVTTTPSGIESLYRAEVVVIGPHGDESVVVYLREKDSEDSDS